MISLMKILQGLWQDSLQVVRQVLPRLEKPARLCLLAAFLAIPSTHAETAAQNTTPSPAPIIPCALLTLEVTPSGATTLLNGRILDQNVWLISLLPGIHTLEVRRTGFKPFARELDLAPGARLQLSVNLQKEP